MPKYNIDHPILISDLKQNKRQVYLEFIIKAFIDRVKAKLKLIRKRVAQGFKVIGGLFL